MANYLVYTTMDNPDTAKQMAKILVSENLVACCTINQNVTSIFSWDGNIEEAIEQQMMLKTTDIKVDKLIERIKELHTYQVPEIIVVPIEKGNNDYLMWMEAVVNVGF